MPTEFGVLTLSMSTKCSCWHGLFERLKRVMASQLSLGCLRTPLPYLFSLRAALSPSSPPFFHPSLKSSHLKAFLVHCPNIFQTLPGHGSYSLTLLGHRHSFWHGGSCAPLLHCLHPVGVAAATPSHHCCRHLLVPFSSVPLMSLQQQLCISFWQGFKNTAKRHL